MAHCCDGKHEEKWFVSSSCEGWKISVKNVHLQIKSWKIKAKFLEHMLNKVLMVHSVLISNAVKMQSTLH
jgi:hypothetical protein